MIRCITRLFKKQPHLKVFLGHDGWRVRLVAANGEIMMSSEAYATRSNAVRAADNIAIAFGLEVVADPVSVPVLET